MRLLTPLHPPTISDRLDSMKVESIAREKDFTFQLVQNERVMKYHETLSRQKCEFQVKLH